MSRALVSLPAAVLCLALTGCGEQTIDTEYGSTSGLSVNGTGAFADLFKQAGHSVSNWKYLSPYLGKADTIVWFPDDFNAPSEEICEWLDNWLRERPGRTLIYVGRDYDAAPSYWRQIKPLAPAELRAEIDRRKSLAEGDIQAERTFPLTTQECPWFKVEDSKPRRATTLAGPWADGVDPAKAEIELNRQLVPLTSEEELLTTKDETLISRAVYEAGNWKTWDIDLGEWEEPDYEQWNEDGQQGDSSQLIIVSNGSFLLNLPLVNHENRKIAARLVAETGQPGMVVFLKSDMYGPDIRSDDPQVAAPSGLEVFGVWPLNFALLHLAALGIIFCFARAPLFGQARDPQERTMSDFGQHVSALGELLQATRDEAYASGRLQYYQQHVRD